MELVAVRLREIFNPVQQRRAFPATGRTSLKWHRTSVSARQGILSHPKKHDVTLSFMSPSRGVDQESRILWLDTTHKGGILVGRAENP